MKRSLFPNWWQSVAITITMVIIILLIHFLSFFIERALDVNTEFMDLIKYVCSVGLVAVGLGNIYLRVNKDVPFIESSKIDSSSLNLKVIAIASVLTIILVWGICPMFTELIPIPDVIRERLLGMMNRISLYSFMLMVVCAPVFEEYIFRGVILRGLLTQMSAIKAILLSSILFGVAHLNPWQFMTGFLIGLFSGWLYYKTRDIKLSILVHMLANATGYFFRVYWKNALNGVDIEYMDLVGGVQVFYLIIICSFLIFLIGIYHLNRLLKTKVLS